MTPSAHRPVVDRDLVAALAGLVLVLAAAGALTRVFVDTSWVPATVLAAALGTLVPAVARRLRVHALVSAAASLLGLAVFAYVTHLESGPFLPGTEELGQLRDLATTGLEQLRDEPAPTIPLDGLMVIVTTSVWVVAHAVHELVVRLRRPGLGLGVATVLWAVPLAVPLPLGRTWPQTLPFLAAAALLLLVEADSDVANATRDREGPLLPTAGVGVAVVAIVVAGLFPAVLPGYDAPAWVDVAGGSDPRGYQPIVDIGDRLRLPGDRDVLRYESDRRVYLRLAALDTFDGTTWRLGPANAATFRPDPSELTRATASLPPEVPLGSTTPLDLDVEVLDLENIYVPVPYQPTRVSGDGAAAMVYSTVGGFVATADLADNEIGGRLVTGVTPGLRYRVEALVPSPAPSELRQVQVDPDLVAPWLELPGDYDEYAALAEQVYREAGATTNVDKALALQDFFIGPGSDFGYSTDVAALRGSGALRDFVFTTRLGYCEYFATAMAVMLRASGIPARVAVGFLGGRVTTPADPAAGLLTNTFTVSTSDAHAWVEVLFPGSGWVRFEPTPRTDGQVQVPTAGDLTPDQTRREQELGVDGPITEFDDPVSDVPTDLPTDVPTDAGAEPAGGTGGGTGAPAPLAALAAALLLAAAYALYRAWRPSHGAQREEAPATRVLRVQHQVLRSAAQLGVPRRAAATMPEALRTWASEGRIDAGDAHELGAVCQAAAFGGVVEPGEADRAERIGDRVVTALRASVEPRDRLLAPARLPAERAVAAGRTLVGAARGSRPPGD